LRYGPAECGGIVVAFVASFIVRRATRNAIAAGYAAAWGESFGYISIIAIRDLVSEARDARRRGRRPGARDTGNVLAGLLAEFGPASVIDTLVTRPIAMAAGVRWLGPVLGIVAGKLAADVVFYSPVIYMYERRKRRRSSS
jgi:hypothetical protein